MTINSFLDNDLYKFTQMFAVLCTKTLSNLQVRYNFFNRNDVKFPNGFDVELKKRVQEMANLKMTKDEKAFFIKKAGHYLSNWFFDLLEGYRYDPNEVSIFQENGHLRLKIEGYWWRTILWEVPLMALISELYFEMTNTHYDFYSNSNRQARLDNNMRKASMMILNSLKVSDFSTRRRYSYENQKEMLQDLISYGRGSIVGTSNVHLAHIFDLNPHGTQAHEWYMVHAVLYGYKMANRMGLSHWVDAYSGELGTSLTDTFTSDEFFKTFNTLYAKLFDGVRHDSGDPFQYIDKVVAHYKLLNIDYSSKTIVFSDGLNVELAAKIMDYCRKAGIRAAFGIGTNLSNDLGVKPLNMVIKVTHVFFEGEWLNAVKLSDNLGKHTGDIDEIALCKMVLKIPEISYDRQPAGNEEDKPKINTLT